MPPFLGREPATLQRTMAVPETRHRCKHDRMTFECAVEGEKEAYLAATLSVRQMTPGPAVLMAVLGRAAWPLRADLMEPFMAALDLDTLEASEALGPLSDPFAPSILSGRRSMRWWSGVAMSSTGTSGWVSFSQRARRKGIWSRWDVSGLLKMALATNTGRVQALWVMSTRGWMVQLMVGEENLGRGPRKEDT